MTPYCGHRVCRKLAGCAWQPQEPAAEIRTGCCPDCGVWLQNGEEDHRRVVHEATSPYSTRKGNE